MFYDLPFARLTWYRNVTVGMAAGVETLADPSGLTTPNLVCVVFAVELPHQAPKAHENSVGDALVNRTNLDTEER